MKMTAFWDIAPCSLVEVDRRFSGAYCLVYQSAETLDETTRRYIPECCHPSSVNLVNYKGFYDGAGIIIVSSVVDMMRLNTIPFSGQVASYLYW
jgi:hypothetical protein